MVRATTFKRSIIFGLIVVTRGLVATSAQNVTSTNYTVHTLPLPDNGTGDVSMDYIAFDPATSSFAPCPMWK